LLNSLLKRIHAPLRKLASPLSSRTWNIGKIPSLNDPCLPQFFESCHPFSQTLQTLKIGHTKIIYSDCNLSASRNRFPQLSSLKIKGQFELINDSNTILLPLFKQITSLGDSLRTVQLSIWIDNTVKSLLSLLPQVNKLKILRKLSVEIQVRFSGSKDLEDLGIGFEDVINELKTRQNYSKAKKVSLQVWTVAGSEQMKDFFDVFGEKFEGFEVRPEYRCSSEY